MIAKNWTRWMTLLVISTLTISGCSLLPNKKVEIVSKPIEIDIIKLKQKSLHIVEDS